MEKSFLDLSCTTLSETSTTSSADWAMVILSSGALIRLHGSYPNASGSPSLLNQVPRARAVHLQHVLLLLLLSLARPLRA